MFYAVQTDFCIRIACFGAGKMLSGSGGRLDNERMKGATIGGDAFNRCD
jgi:hypothetical protein